MVRPMVRWLSAAALGVLLITVQACGRTPETQAVPSVQALLAAVAADDAQGFETHLDRPAVRADLRRQLQDLARQSGLEVDGGPSDAALDRMIGPDALHLVQAGSGQPLAAAPSAAQVALMIRPADGGRVCLHDQSPAHACLLTFAREGQAWRLVGMPAADVRIETPPAPSKAP